MPRLTPIQLLILAVILTGIGPVLVRQSPVGPASTAFWRLVIALPFSLWLGRQALKLSLGDAAWALSAGLLLAGDLILWNNAILRTSVMEATVLVMVFPIIVAGIEIGFLGRRLAWTLLAGGAVIAWAMKRSRGGPAAAGGRDVAFAAPAASDLPSRDTVPADPKLAAAVRRVRMLAYGWPQGFSPKAGS